MSAPKQKYIDAARLAGVRIAQLQRSDGSFFDVEAGVGGYYKVPYALFVSGYFTEAIQFLRWVRRHHFTPDGDFRAKDRKALQPYYDDWPTYPNAWLVQAAHRLGQFDLSFGGMQFLQRYRADCGGFLAFEDGEPHVECVATSWAGLAAVTVGDLETALGAADHLERLVEKQPDPSRFYFRTTPDGELITDFPDENALAFFVDASRDKQIYFQPGISLIFLCRYYMATARQKALQAANSIFEFTQRCADDVYCYPPSGKLGLGCALLAAITSNDLARQAACKVADYLVRTQQSDGSWILPDEEMYNMITDKQHPEPMMDLSAEFCTFLWEIAATL